MDTQLKRQLTFSLEETAEIRQAYASYVAAGGEQKSINKWMKDIIMKKVRE